MQVQKGLVGAGNYGRQLTAAARSAALSGILRLHQWDGRLAAFRAACCAMSSCRLRLTSSGYLQRDCTGEWAAFAATFTIPRNGTSEA